MIALMIVLAILIWPILLVIVVGVLALGLIEGWLEASEPRLPNDWRRHLRCDKDLLLAKRPRVELTRYPR